MERRVDLDRASFVREYLSRNRPVVLSTECAAWCARWEPSALGERYGRCSIVAEETREVYVGERTLVERPLASFVDAMLVGDTGVRWKGLDFLARVPGLRDDLERDPPPFRAWTPDAMSGPRSTLWLAPARTMSSLHHDGNYDNLNMQASGRKLWCLVPPTSHAALYCHGSAESPVNPFTPDLARFPRFAEARPVEALLAPGDTLFVPKYWWHCVYAVEPSVNLATCFSWTDELSAWSVLDGAPLIHRSLTAAAATMKQYGLHRLANASRRAWWAAHRRLFARAAPQPRGELVDPL